MSDSRVRREIAVAAARMMYDRTEREYYTAKRKAARQFGIGGSAGKGGRGGGSLRDLPSNAEIREQIEVLARMHEGESRKANLIAMRLTALRLLRLLEAFDPRLIGSVLTGHVRRGSDIDIHVFSNSTGAVVETLELSGFVCDVEHKRVLKHGRERVFTHIRTEARAAEIERADGRFAIELTLYAEDQRSYVFKSSITGKAIETANARELLVLIEGEHPGVHVDAALAELDDPALDRFELWAMLLEPLGRTKQNPRHHPEGDALYHSLQVFQLALDAKPWDEEFVSAALLHDVGKAIDPHDHVEAGLMALGSSITDRTRFLIAHHMDALHLYDGKIAQRQVARLRRHADFDDLMLLREMDNAGRRGGVIVPTLDEALEAIRCLSEEGYLNEHPG